MLRKTIKNCGFVVFGAQTYCIYRSWTKEPDLHCIQNNLANLEYVLRKKASHVDVFDASTAHMCLRIIENRGSIQKKLSVSPEEEAYRQFS